MAAEQWARAETGVPYGVKHLVVQEKSREEKTRKWSEQARFSGCENHCTPFEGNRLMVITYGNLISSGSRSGRSEVKGILVWKDQSVCQKNNTIFSEIIGR